MDTYSFKLHKYLAVDTLQVHLEEDLVSNANCNV